MHGLSWRLAALAAAFVSLWMAAPAGAEPLTSDRCGECHKAIFRAWRGSAHARAMEDEIFLEAFRATEIREGKEVSRICLRCHAPLAEVTRDLTLQQKLSWEGVNCDVCHSLTNVDFAGPSPTGVLEIGSVKRGPIRDAESGAHEVAFSELHTQAAACAWCHEYQSPEGASLMSTYTEWKSSSASEKGVTCQECHMFRTKGDVVDPKITRVGDGEVNLHEVPGGHSIDQLNKALRVVMKPIRRGDSLFVSVQLTNKGAGHAVPTGMPSRRVILELTVRPYGSVPLEERVTYGRSFVDAAGSPIQRDSEYFRAGVRAAADTRIGPDESRTESFRFAVPPDVIVQAGVRLIYEHLPLGEPASGSRITFFTESRTLHPEGKSAG